MNLVKVVYQFLQNKVRFLARTQDFLRSLVKTKTRGDNTHSTKSNLYQTVNFRDLSHSQMHFLLSYPRCRQYTVIYLKGKSNMNEIASLTDICLDLLCFGLTRNFNMFSKFLICTVPHLSQFDGINQNLSHFNLVKTLNIYVEGLLDQTVVSVLYYW